MQVVRIEYPEWTAYQKKDGLDPLGMQNSSINLYQRLLPGISNVTLRIRYYGFYAWLAARYARTEGSTDRKAWKRTLRRAEALYALACSANEDVSGIAGIRWANRYLRENDGVVFGIGQNPGLEKLTAVSGAEGTP